MAGSGGMSTDMAGRKRPPELQVGGRRLSSSLPVNTTGSSVGLSNGISRHRRDQGSVGGNAATSSVSINSPILKKPKLKKTSSSLRKSKAQQASLLIRWERQLESTATALNISLERQFRRHGKYVSRHPIKTLLVACLIITSLFYPAAGIYLWASKGGPGVTRGDARSVWRSLSTPFLDSFASSGRKHHNSLRDLRMVWDDAPDLRAVDARDADAYLGSIVPLNILPNSWPAESKSDGKGDNVEDNRMRCTSVRVEHVFVTTDDVMLGMGHRYGALDIPILQSAMSLQSTIEAYLQRGHDKLQCLQAVDSKGCLTLSPLSYWEQDFRQLSADSSPTGTLLATKRNVSQQGIPLSLTTTLAGRSHLFTKLPRADHLALTFFLYDTEGNDCQTRSDKKSAEPLVANDRFGENHEAWIGMLRNITGGQVGILNSEVTTTKEVILQFNPLQTSNTFFTQRLFLTFGYAAAFLWLCRGLMRLQKVHSRFGLAFTGVLELILSMTLAVSICALCGVRLTLVPWEILPFVIVVLGSENMFVLTNAIISTPTSLTVPTRIATGLGKVGVPIAVTVMSDVLLMLAIMVFVDVRAVREFCIFAIFSLFVDFFMQMTFFATVLSIDLQRLELADLLSQGGAKEPQDLTGANERGAVEEDMVLSEELTSPNQNSMNKVRGSSRNNRRGTSSKSSLGSSFIKMSCRAVWRARTARTASLSLLLAFMFGIYLYHGSGYPSLHSYPFQQSNTTHPSISASIPSSTMVADTDGSPRFDPFSHLSRDSLDSSAGLPLPWWHNSPSALFWQAMNPQDALSVRVKVEPWTVLSLRSTKSFEKGRRTGMAHFASWAIFRPRVRAFIWFFKLAVLPIAGTTGLLWVLLLYLLKDTELLEAQRDRSEGLGGSMSDEEDHEELQSTRQAHLLEAEINLSTNIASQASDIILLGQSGGYMISVAADSSLSVWKPSKRGKNSTVLLSAIMKDFSRVTALEADAELDMIALGHGDGRITIWKLSTLSPLNLSRDIKGEMNGESSRQPLTQVQSIFFIPTATDHYFICSAHRDGSIWQWRQDHCENVLAAQSEAFWTAFSPNSSEGECRNLIAMMSSNRQFQLYRICNSSPQLTCLLSVQDDGPIARCATMSTLSVGEEERDRESVWSVVIVGTDRGQVVVYDLKTNSNIGHYDVFDGTITSIRGVDLAQACPVYAGSGSRDLILVNSATRATVLTLSNQSDRIVLSSSVYARSQQIAHIPATPHKNGIDLPSINSSASLYEAFPPKTRAVSDIVGAPIVESESNGLSPNGKANGMHQGGLLFEPLPLPKALDGRNRRSSSHGKRPVFEEDHNALDKLESFSSSNSAIGSAPSSILDSFDVDPFDAANGSSNNGDEGPLHWSRHASIECTRGEAEVVIGVEGARIVGVRRRAKLPQNLSALDVRWEVFQLDVTALLTLDRAQSNLLEVKLIRRSRLALEDNLLFQQQTSGISGLSFNDLAPSSRAETSSSSRNLPALLSFTRLDHVQVFNKDRGGIEKPLKKKEKRNIAFSFANCVACVTLYSNHS